MTNRKRCYLLLEMLNKAGHDLAIDSNSQGLRVTNGDGQRDISDRLRPVHLLIWLQGYLRCHEFNIERMRLASPIELCGEHDVVLDAIREASLHQG